MADCTRESGTCDACIGACKRKPGWFRPGELEPVAEFLGLTMHELFDTRLAIDWWEADANAPLTFSVAPAIANAPAGVEYPVVPNGRCTFLTDDDRCEIHEVKPYECRDYWCGRPERDVSVWTHLESAKAWGEHQDEIVRLLGRKPLLPDVDVDDIIEMLFGA